MSTAPVMQSGPSTKPALRVPPEDAFWKHYSPHSEFEVSAAGSVALHLLAIGLVAFVAFLAIRLGLSGDDKPLPVDSVTFGGGSDEEKPRGDGNSGRDAAAESNERDGKTNRDGKPNPKPSLERPQLTPDQARPIEVELGNGPPRDLGAAPLAEVRALSQKIREQLQQSRASAGHGEGRDVGRDTGTDKDKGPGKAEKRPRLLRWSLIFDTKSGADYAKQLAGFDAILALQEGEKFRVIRDLSKRPALGKIEDVTKIDRIFWIDDKEQSVKSLAKTLGWPDETPRFVAFFPEELEKRLLELEMEFARKTHGKKVGEEDIHKTKFRVIKTGDKYDVEVVAVDLKD